MKSGDVTSENRAPFAWDKVFGFWFSAKLRLLWIHFLTESTVFPYLHSHELELSSPFPQQVVYGTVPPPRLQIHICLESRVLLLCQGLF